MYERNTASRELVIASGCNRVRSFNRRCPAVAILRRTLRRNWQSLPTLWIRFSQTRGGGATRTIAETRPARSTKADSLSKSALLHEDESERPYSGADNAARRREWRTEKIREAHGGEHCRRDDAGDQRSFYHAPTLADRRLSVSIGSIND